MFTLVGGPPPLRASDGLETFWAYHSQGGCSSNCDRKWEAQKIARPSDARRGGGPPTSVNIFLTLTLSLFADLQRSVLSTSLVGIGSHVPSPPPADAVKRHYPRGYSGYPIAPRAPPIIDSLGSAWNTLAEVPGPPPRRDSGPTCGRSLNCTPPASGRPSKFLDHLTRGGVEDHRQMQKFS